MGEVKLEVGGRGYGGWKEIEIIRTVETLAGSFVLKLAPTSQTAGREFRARARVGAACVVRMDGVPLITGHVEMTDGLDTEVTVSGRDKTGDLVDCSVPLRDWKNVFLQRLAATLCEPFGIEVVVRPEAAGTAPFEKVTSEQEETVFDFLDRLARQRGLRLWTEGDGRLQLGQPGDELSPLELHFGVNCRNRRVRRDGSELFSKVEVFTPEGQPKVLSAETKAPSGSATDDAVERYRPLSIQAEQPGTVTEMKERAEEELRNRRARALRAAYSVIGWRDESETIWPAGKIVGLRDRDEGFDGTRLLLAEAKFVFNDQVGEATTLTLVPPEALNRAVEPETEAVGGAFA